jgi:hypothetical protein
MDLETKKQIEEHVKTLPKASQEALETANWEEEIRAIGYRHGLMLDEIDRLYAETLLALIGLTDPREYTDNIIDHVGVSQELAKKIITEAQFEIFEPIRKDVEARMSKSAEEHSELFEEQEIPKKDPGASSPQRMDVLSGIENPEKSTASMSVSKLKLEDVFSQVPETSEMKNKTSQTPKSPPAKKLSIQNIEAEAAPDPQPERENKDYSNKKNDPYLEPLD